MKANPLNAKNLPLLSVQEAKIIKAGGGPLSKVKTLFLGDLEPHQERLAQLRLSTNESFLAGATHQCTHIQPSTVCYQQSLRPNDTTSFFKSSFSSHQEAMENDTMEFRDLTKAIQDAQKKNYCLKLPIIEEEDGA